MLGLCGAHRTGKTTLARVVSEGAGLPLIEISTTPVFETLGLSPKMDYPFSTRIQIQNAILDNMEASFLQAPGHFISDRTPVDALAYTLADVQRDNLNREEQGLLLAYMRRAIDLTNRHFSILIVIQPGIPLIEEEGKAPANLAYMEHLNSLIMGLVIDDRLSAAHFALRRDITDMEERLSAVGSVLRTCGSRFMDEAQNVGYH